MSAPPLDQSYQLTLWQPEMDSSVEEVEAAIAQPVTLDAVASATPAVRVMMTLTRPARPHLRNALEWDQRRLDRWKTQLAESLPSGMMMQVTIHDRWRERFKLVSASQSQQIAVIHWALLADPDRVVRLLASYACTRKVAPEDHRWASELTVPQRDVRLTIATTAGVHLDLRGMYTDLLLRLGEHESTAALTGYTVSWSPAPAREGRHGSIRLGSCDHGRHRILLNPKLDDARVPRYVLESVLWHEMAHVLRPPIRNGRRREVHHAEFHALDRLFSEHEAARTWVTANIQWLLQ